MEISKLNQKKRRAKAKGDLKLLAETSNHLGDIYFQTGKYEEALEEYKCQLACCEALNDSMMIAVANRMIGEVLTSMGKFEEALVYQNIYLDLAKKTGELIELQRAYATLGRTQFCLSQLLTNDSKCEALNAAKKAYVTSLEMCNKIEETGAKIERKEVMTMRARLLLNLGLVLEAKKQADKAIDLMKKAVLLCERDNLQDDLHRTFVSMGAIYERLKSYESAREYYQKAAITEDYSLKEAARLNEAELLVKLGKWKEARQILVQLYVNHKSGLQEAVPKLLKIVAGIEAGETQLKTEGNNRKRLKIYEDLGDTACAGNAFECAIEYYRNMLACAEIGDVEDKTAAALVSLAQTLKDVENYSEASIYARKELELCKDPKEIARSALFLAELLILTGAEHAQIVDTFQTALDNAGESQNSSFKLSVLKDMLDYFENKRDEQAGEDNSEKISQIKKEIEELRIGMPDEESSDEEDEEADSSKIEIDIDELSDVEDERQKKGEKSVKKYRPRRQEFKKNVKGEMPLQVACIEGNIEKVQELLDQGHPVNVRDYCGWTPLHEAANHGFVEITELLLKFGADINDPGGKECSGITPLHDAAICGHTAIVNLLIARGADPLLRTHKGESVLDCLETWRKNVGALSEEDETDYQATRNKLSLIIPVKKSTGHSSGLKQVKNPLIDPDGDDPPMIPPNLPAEKRISAGEDYRRTIESLKCNRSRIMMPVSPRKDIAPLIDCDEALVEEEDWLDESEDILSPRKRRSTSSLGTPGSSKKKSTPGDEKNSSKRKSSNITPSDDRNAKRQKNHESDNFIMMIDDDNSNESIQSDGSASFTAKRLSFNRPQKKKQSSLLTSGFTRNLDSRTPSPVLHDPMMNSQLRSQKIDSYQRHSDSVAVEVNLENIILKTKLKVQSNNETLVANLTNDIVRQFEEITGCTIKIEFTTLAGLVLQPDNVINIIYASEGLLQLAGRVIEFQIPPIVERFEKISKSMKIEVDDQELLRSLRSCKNTGIFRLKSDEVLDVELLPILRCLEYEKSLQVLHLSSGNLHNLGGEVNKAIEKLNNLQELHLQGCDINDRFLNLIDHFPSQLRVLDLSYNPLKNDEKLGELISSLRHLQTLNLRSCQLEKFPTTSISSSLVNLDISGNFMDGDSVECVLQKQIANLNISNTENSRIPLKSVFRSLINSETSIFSSLETLDLSGCKLKNTDVLNLLEKCRNLSKFILGDNREVSQAAVEALLERKPTLMLIDVTGCEEITRMPSLDLKIDKPSVCTLMASISPMVSDAWKELWSQQAIVYKQPHSIVIIRPIT